MTDMQFKETAVFISKNKTNKQHHLLRLRQVPTVVKNPLSLLLGCHPAQLCEAALLSIPFSPKGAHMTQVTRREPVWVHSPHSLSLSIQWFSEGFSSSVVLGLSKRALPQLLTQHDDEVQ